jgi:KDO2-lipid IV(A) lauroyltransferase
MIRYWLFWLGVRLACVLPTAWGGRLAELGGLLAYALGSQARVTVRANLCHVLGHPPPERIVRAVFEHGARNYYDLLSIPRYSAADMRALVEVHGWENLEAARAAGKGVLLVTAHLGSVSFVGQMFAIGGCPSGVVVEPLEPPALLDLLVKLRGTHGSQVLPIGPGLLRAMVDALGRNELVALFSDRDVLGSGVEVRFFDAPTRLPGGAAGLGLRSGAAVLPGFTIRTADGRHLMWLEPPLTLTRTGDPRADVRLNTERIARTLEAAIRRHPEQWTVYQPVWPESPAPP